MESAKKLKDLRGGQARIGRLLPFYLQGFIHMLFYRIMVPLSILYGICIFVYLFLPGMGTVLKAFTAVIWILWTPQLFEVARGLALAWSRGMAFGRLNREFARLYRKKYSRHSAPYLALPWVVLVAWAAGFVLMILRWFP